MKTIAGIFDDNIRAYTEAGQVNANDPDDFKRRAMSCAVKRL